MIHRTVHSAALIQDQLQAAAGAAVAAATHQPLLMLLLQGLVGTSNPKCYEHMSGRKLSPIMVP